MPILSDDEFPDFIGQLAAEVQRLGGKLDDLKGNGISNEHHALSIDVPSPPPDAPVEEMELPVPMYQGQLLQGVAHGRAAEFDFATAHRDPNGDPPEGYTGYSGDFPDGYYDHNGHFVSWRDLDAGTYAGHR